MKPNNQFIFVLIALGVSRGAFGSSPFVLPPSPLASNRNIPLPIIKPNQTVNTSSPVPIKPTATPQTTPPTLPRFNQINPTTSPITTTSTNQPQTLLLTTNSSTPNQSTPTITTPLITPPIISNPPTQPTPVIPEALPEPNVNTTTDTNHKDSFTADLNSKDINANAPMITIKVGESYTFIGPANSTLIPQQSDLDRKKKTRGLTTEAIKAENINPTTLKIIGIRESTPNELPYPIFVSQGKTDTRIALVRVSNTKLPAAG